MIYLVSRGKRMLPSQIIHQALNELADRCDGALAEDGKGFNSEDTNFGKSLAKSPKLTPKMAKSALKMLIKYRQQLGRYGVQLPEMEELENEINQSRVVVPERPQELDSLGQSSPLPLLDFTGLTVAVAKDQVVITFPYTKQLLGFCKLSLKAKYLKENNQHKWLLPLSNLVEVVKKVEEANIEYRLTPAAKESLRMQKLSKNERRIHERKRANWCLNYLKKDRKNWKIEDLYPHQWEAVERILTQESATSLNDVRVILADLMGLGKSLTGLTTAKAYQAYLKEFHNEEIAIIVVAPVSLCINMKREADFINLDILTFSYQKCPNPLENQKYFVIADEAHNLQTWRSQRTEKMKVLTSHDNCAGFLPMTGTPLRNGKPVNLYPILHMIRHPLTQIPYAKSEYEKRYCGAYKSNFCWDCSGATNLEELSELISPQMIRRTKDQVGFSLPKKTQVPVNIPVSEYKEQDNQYVLRIKQAQKQYKERIVKGEVDRQAEAIAMLSAFRKASSLFKMRHAATLAEDILEQGDSVVIFTEFRESANYLAEKFGTRAYTGEVKQEQRDQLVQDFQNKKTRIFVGTIKAGGLGLTLTTSSYLIMVDLPYTIGDYEQSQDRVHRIGQTRPVTIYTLYAYDIDYIMSGIIGEKEKVVKEILDDILKKNNKSVNDLNNPEKISAMLMEDK